MHNPHESKIDLGAPLDGAVMVLLVDDQAMAGEAVRRSLASETDIDFHFRSDPQQTVVMANQIKPTVTPQDLVMPSVDGLTLLAAYRGNPATHDIPIVVLSTKGGPTVKSAAFAADANDCLVKLPNTIELVIRVRYHSRSYIALQQHDEAYRVLRESQQQLPETDPVLQRLMNSDGLIGLSNRRRFDEYLEMGWCRSLREQLQLSLLMIGVDYFKSYNDTFGHVVGSEALRQVAGTVYEGCSRSSDLAVRYGDEEFAMVLSGASPGGARLLAEKVQCTVENLQISRDQSCPDPYLTASISASTLMLGDDGQTSRVLTEMADQALCQAKNNSRNQVGLMEQSVPLAPAGWAAHGGYTSPAGTKQEPAYCPRGVSAIYFVAFRRFLANERRPWKSTRFSTALRTPPNALRLFGGTFNYDQKHSRLVEVNRELEDPNVWNNPEYAQNPGRERAQLTQVTGTSNDLISSLADSRDLLDMAVEEDDRGAIGDATSEVGRLHEILEKLELHRMFSGEMDLNNAYLDTQAGPGGIEAQDRANMLLHMHLHQAGKHGFNAIIIELSESEVAGTKGAAVHIKGEYTFDWLCTGIDMRRLVRKSPFGLGNHRHTPFTVMFISPEIDDNVEIEINPVDLCIDTYRSPGAGSQHVNTTDPAVRIIHVPTNIMVACQNKRSQYANKGTAMKILRAKLYKPEMQKRTVMSQALEDSKFGIGWSYQIRSYVLGQSRAKDPRTDIERGDCNRVLDGDPDEYLEASLKQGL